MSVFEGKAWISKQGLVDVSIEVENGYISSVKKTSLEPKKEKAQGLILPAALDMHVHFRDPGYPHKEDWKTGSESAACGGVTAVVDMPNTNPFTSDISSFKDKEQIAKSKSIVDFGIGINVEENLTEQDWFGTVPAAFWKLYPYGISSDDYFRLAKEVLDKTKKPMVVHCEHPDYMYNNPLEKLSDHTENRLVAEEKCLASMPSSEYLHVAHLSTANGLKNLPPLSSTEVCPHHLLLNLDNCSSLDCKVDPPEECEDPLYALFPSLSTDVLLGETKVPRPPRDSGTPFEVLLWVHGILQLFVMGTFFWFAFNTGLNFWLVVGALSTGLSAAASAIVTAHELGHTRPRSPSWWLSRVLLFSVNYLHFTTEHNYNHHRWVATDKDPASATEDESS